MIGEQKRICRAIISQDIAVPESPFRPFDHLTDFFGDVPLLPDFPQHLFICQQKGQRVEVSIVPAGRLISQIMYDPCFRHIPEPGIHLYIPYTVKLFDQPPILSFASLRES